MFCDVDGNFPNHHPDPAHVENLQDLMKCLRETDCELGLAFDGDGDRLGVVTKDGQVIFPDRQLMLFAEEILGRNPGSQVIYDVKCTGKLAPWIRQHGGEPLMWKTGHSLVKAKLKETGAPIAGEMSGHVFFKDRWYGFDDGLYTGARLLEILSRHADPSAVLNALPNANNTPELQLKCAEGEPFTLLDKIKATRSSRRARGDHDRWRARGISRRLRPGTSVEHHARGGDAFRGRQRRGTGAHPGRIQARDPGRKT